MGSANKSRKPKFQLEYLTYSLPSLHPEITGAGVDVMDVWHVRVVVIVKYVREMKVDEREGGEKRRKSTDGE